MTKRNHIEIRDGEDKPVRLIQMFLSEEEWFKLNELAKCKKTTPEKCIRDFIYSCQPGDTQWRGLEKTSLPKWQHPACK